MRTPPRLLLPLLVIACLGGPARADGLADLRAALSALRAEAAPADTLKAQLDVQFSAQAGEAKRPTQGRVRLQVESSREGLQLFFPQAILKNLAEEATAAQRAGGAPQGLRGTVRGVDPAEVAELVDFAPALLRVMGTMRLKADRPDSLRGQPARLLLVQMDVPLPEEQRKHLKSLEVEGRIHLGPDNLPLSFSYTASFKGSRFLITFEGQQSDEKDLRRVGGRLVVTRQSHRDSGSGFGQRAQGQRTVTLTVTP